MEVPTLDEFIDFLRNFARIPAGKMITAETLIEDDLGITGDAGLALLKEAEKRFGVHLCSEEHGFRQTFNLEPNEYLFSSEGLGLIGLLHGFFGTNVTVRVLAVGELYDAVCRASLEVLGNTL
jgi:hypothetical protein